MGERGDNCRKMTANDSHKPELILEPDGQSTDLHSC